MGTKFTIEEVDFFPSKRAVSNEYSPIYEMIASAPLESPRRIGPFSRREANSVQTSITEKFKDSLEFKVFTTIRDIHGDKPSSDEEGRYVFVTKVARVNPNSSQED